MTRGSVGPNPFVRAAALAAALFVAGAGGLAAAQAQQTPAEAIAYRREQLRHLGAAFKATNDQLRARSPDLAAIAVNAQTISQLAAAFPTWFPTGAGPGAGLETHARPEVWTQRAAFEAKARQFRAAAGDLSAASAARDLALIRTRVRALGASCASCHADFRERP